MDNRNYKTFRQFNDIGLAQELIELLKNNNIGYILEDNTPHFDVSFANNKINDEYRLKIAPENFELVNNLLENTASKYLDSVEQEHYLFTFSNDELLEIIKKKNEWSAFDFLLARKILGDRGVSISDANLLTFEKERMTELSKPEKINNSWFYFGFLFALLGGFFGFIIGWFIKTNKKTLPNGSTVYCYIESDRNKGNVMFLLGIITFLLTFLFQLFKRF